MRLLTRFALMLLAVLALPLATACAPLSSAPAPLASTTLDDEGLHVAWRAFDVALDSINLLTDIGVIKAGTPSAKSIATAIRTVNASLAAAERFAAAGSHTDYVGALLEARAGMDEIRRALTELKGT